MKIGKSCEFFCVAFLLAILFAGCSSSGDGGNSANSSGYELYSTPESDLVLQIPDTLEVSQEDIESIYYNADQVAHCYTTSREAIDIVLAEACIYYDILYLYPDYFPENLNGILTVSAYVGYLSFYDPYTFYFSPEDFVEIMSYFSGNSAFIGFSLSCSGQTVTDDTPLIINGIDPYTRAWIDGFEVGDSIIEIDGISVTELSLDTISALLPTAEEEPVEITVDRDGVEITISTAAEEHIGLRLYDDIAYLSVRSFTETTGEEVRLDYQQLQTDAGGAIDKIILDLRDNGGGVHSGTIMLVDYLINMDDGSNPIMTRYGPAFDEETEYLGDYNDSNIGDFFSIGDFDKTNFVLLVDENSASASEIVAAALKYYETAYLIGETTYGKGIGQSVIELIDGTGVVIPSLISLDPSGESYHGIGVDPDQYSSGWATSFEDDPVLDAAVDYLDSATITSTSASTDTIESKRISDGGLRMDPFQEKLLKKNRSGNYF